MFNPAIQQRVDNFVNEILDIIISGVTHGFADEKTQPAAKRRQSEPHKVSRPFTEKEVEASDNLVIKSNLKKAKKLAATIVRTGDDQWSCYIGGKLLVASRSRRRDLMRWLRKNRPDITSFAEAK